MAASRSAPISADYLLGRVTEPTGEDLEAADPEIAALFRRFQGMSEEARGQIKHLFETVDTLDKKGVVPPSRNSKLILWCTRHANSAGVAMHVQSLP